VGFSFARTRNLPHSSNTSGAGELAHPIRPPCHSSSKEAAQGVGPAGYGRQSRCASFSKLVVCMLVYHVHILSHSDWIGLSPQRSGLSPLPIRRPFLELECWRLIPLWQLLAEENPELRRARIRIPFRTCSGWAGVWIYSWTAGNCWHLFFSFLLVVSPISTGQ
jgi:hypothetical protein